MNDRELLELAAKAAGIDGDVETYTWNAAKWGRPESESKTSMFIRTGPTEAWNPLNNDGDALRLAVKLGMTVLADPGIDGSVAAQIYPPTSPLTSVWAYELAEPDSYAATRRAIVRAAAEIGKLR